MDLGRGGSYEGKTIGQAPLSEVQGSQAQGRDIRDLHKPQTQTETGQVTSEQQVVPW
jgi:hypothetical protein